jgi:general secretion pathway protein B
MSLILDALKKLDREKSSRRDGTANIAVEILRADKPRPGKRMLRYFAALSITAAATACVTYAIIAGFGILSKSSPPATVNPPPGQQVASALPSREPAVASKEEISQAPVKIPAVAETKPPATPPAKKADRALITKQPDVVPETIKKSAEPAPRASAAAPPSLKLSGIVWQEEPAERRAMINGRIATEGSIIEGVKVVEIHPTRVRFLHNGRHFEISLGQ